MRLQRPLTHILVVLSGLHYLHNSLKFRMVSGFAEGGYTGTVVSLVSLVSGKTCILQGFQLHGGGNPKTGQAGGLP